MGHPLSQTPGALRKRAWRERVTRMGHPLSQTPEAQRERLRRDGLSSLGHLLDQKDLARASDAAMFVLRGGISTDPAATDAVWPVLPPRVTSWLRHTTVVESWNHEYDNHASPMFGASMWVPTARSSARPDADRGDGRRIRHVRFDCRPVDLAVRSTRLGRTLRRRSSLSTRSRLKRSILTPWPSRDRRAPGRGRAEPARAHTTRKIATTQLPDSADCLISLEQFVSGRSEDRKLLVDRRRDLVRVLGPLSGVIP